MQFKCIDAFIASQDYSKSQLNMCVYSKKLEDEPLIYLLSYIDDMLITAWCMFDIDVRDK